MANRPRSGSSRGGQPTKTKKLACEFYKVDLGHNCKDSLTKVITDFHGKVPNLQERNWEHLDDLYRIEAFTCCGDGGHDSSGLLVRLRDGVAPRVASRLMEGLRELELGPDEHVTEKMAFRYYHESKTLVVERNPGAGGVNRLAEYLRNKTSNKAVHFLLRLKGDNETRLKWMRTVSKMELTVVDPRIHLGDLEGRSVGAVAQLFETFGGLEVQLTIKHKQGRGGEVHALNTEAVVETLEVFSAGLFKTKKARVEGQAKGIDHDVVVDMIKDKVVESVKIPYTGNEPIWTQYFDALEEAYQKRRAELLG